MLSDENIIAFQVLYKEHFGKEITKEDARENGIKLLRLISIIYSPKKEKLIEENQTRLVELK